MWIFFQITFWIALSMVCISLIIIFSVFLYKNTHKVCKSIIYKCETCNNCLESRKRDYNEYYCLKDQRWKYNILLCDNYCKKSKYLRNKEIKL